MIIEIEQPVTPRKVQDALGEMQKRKEKKSLRKHFGKLKRGINALNYQKEVREEWS